MLTMDQRLFSFEMHERAMVATSPEKLSRSGLVEWRICVVLGDYYQPQLGSQAAQSGRSSVEAIPRQVDQSPLKSRPTSLIPFLIPTP